MMANDLVLPAPITCLLSRPVYQYSILQGLIDRRTCSIPFPVPLERYNWRDITCCMKATLMLWEFVLIYELYTLLSYQWASLMALLLICDLLFSVNMPLPQHQKRKQRLKLQFIYDLLTELRPQ